MADGSDHGGLLAPLDEQQRQQLLAACHWKEYRRGEVVVQEGEPSTDLYLIETGLVAAKGFSVDGREVIYNEIGPGHVFGEFSAVDGHPRSATVEALENSRIGRLSSAAFREALKTYPALALALIEDLVRKNRMLTLRVFEYGTMLVRERILAELVRLAVPSDETFVIDPAPSHHELAARLGTHREAVSKELAKLSRSGIITTGRRRIVILDMPRLRKHAGFGAHSAGHR